MKAAKPATGDTPSHRRSQPVRQARNSSRSNVNAGRPGDTRDAANRGPLGNQPIEIYPAITHFADTMSALPKELVRHFTLLKEVDAKIFAPEEQLFKLVAATTSNALPDYRANNDISASAPSESAPMSARDSPGGMAFRQTASSSAQSIDEPNAAPTSVFDPANIPRRQLFRQTAFKIQEMLVSLEEKNHVLSTANEALQRQLARVEDVWPYLENEFSDEAKWGSSTHWAYPENRMGGKVSNAEKARRDGAAAISAAAQALADEAAARSDARKQALQAKKSLKNQHQDSEGDDLDGRQKENSKKSTGKSRKAAADTNSIGLGISGSNASGNPPQKRRKVEKTANGATTGATAGAGAMSMVFSANAPKPKTGSPRGTPAPDGTKKRKALPTSSGQAKKKNGLSPSVASSPVLGMLPDSKIQSQPSPALSSTSRPTTSRARQNSIQSNADGSKARTPLAGVNKTNTNGSNGSGNIYGNGQDTPEVAAAAAPTRVGQDLKPAKDTSAAVKAEGSKKENDRVESSAATPSNATIKESKANESDRKSESAPSPIPLVTVTTKSGRASKPSTPALASMQEAAARARPSRNAEGGGNKKSHKKTGSVAQALIQQAAADTDASSSMQGDDDDAEIDADEPTYCYCNSVSYGEMVACDADGCEREWFHLACVGLKVAPGSKTKWYCEDCKKRLQMGGKKTSGR